MEHRTGRENGKLKTAAVTLKMVQKPCSAIIEYGAPSLRHSIKFTAGRARRIADQNYVFLAEVLPDYT
jgi:hypothetical protein